MYAIRSYYGYEFFYLVGQNNEEKLDEIKKEAEQVLIDEGAVFEELEIITKRKLSYKIKHQIRGTYIAKRFEMPQTPSKDADVITSYSIHYTKLYDPL